MTFDLVIPVLQLQEEKMALVQKVSQYDAVISRRERENEEGENLLAMLQADVHRLNGER